MRYYLFWPWGGKIPRDLLLRVAILLVCASLLFYVLLPVRATAATPYTLQRSSYNQSFVETKNYPRSSIAQLARNASTQIDQGEACRKAWKKQDKMPAAYRYFCWRATDAKNGWIAQGVTGSGSAKTGADGGNNRLLLVSWYTTKNSGLTVPIKADAQAASASRVTLVNMSRERYVHIELAKPCAKSTIGVCMLNSHAGGIAWAGDYLYVASTTGVHVFSMNNLYMISGKPVLVASEWLDLQFTTKKGEMSRRISTISYDSTANQLITSEYREQDSTLPTHVVRWRLDGNRYLTGNGTIRSVAISTTKARCVQGIARYKGAFYAHSSSEEVAGRGGRGGALIKWRPGQSATRKALPHHMQSAYVDVPSKRMWALTEEGDHSAKSFVFSYPLK